MKELPTDCLHGYFFWFSYDPNLYVTKKKKKNPTNLLIKIKLNHFRQQLKFPICAFSINEQSPFLEAKYFFLKVLKDIRWISLVVNNYVNHVL